MRAFEFITETDLNEGPELSSTVKSIAATIGNSITQVYDKLEDMAINFHANHGDLKGFNMVAAGAASRWLHAHYFNGIDSELHHLVQQAQRTAPVQTMALRDWLRTSETSFSAISRQLPRLLADIADRIGAKSLKHNADAWTKNRNDYLNLLRDLESKSVNTKKISKKTKPIEEPAQQTKQIKSELPGQQASQAEMLVSAILRELPSAIAGDIRTAIAKEPNKIFALQRELDKRNIKI